MYMYLYVNMHMYYKHIYANMHIHYVNVISRIRCQLPKSETIIILCDRHLSDSRALHVLYILLDGADELFIIWPTHQTE